MRTTNYCWKLNQGGAAGSRGGCDPLEKKYLGPRKKRHNGKPAEKKPHVQSKPEHWRESCTKKFQGAIFQNFKKLTSQGNRTEDVFPKGITGALTEADC